jgi:tRNA (guanine37-N1)-methyltransferase
MRIWILTLFPDFFKSLTDHGVSGRFFQSDEVQLNTLYLGDYSPKNFKGVDGAPYGGGPGMVMRADVLEAALMDVKKQGGYGEDFLDQVEVIYTAPRGKVFNNIESRALANKFEKKDYVFICGRYEGIDERFIEQYVNKIYSLGDFVLSGGEVAVMTIIDSFTRFIPGVLGNNVSAEDDSFEDGLIEGPQYTRPEEFNGVKVPAVLTSGNHAKIDEFRLQKRKEFTKKLRPDLLKKYEAKIED